MAITMLLRQMNDTQPEGFNLKDKVTFAQLPERIQEYYIGPRYGTVYSLWLKGDRAVLMFFPLPPYKSWIDYWEKTKDGWELARTVRSE